jgi:hypothetical protein
MPCSCHGGKFQHNPLGPTAMSSCSDLLTFRDQVYLHDLGSDIGTLMTDMLLVFEMSVDLTTLCGCWPNSILLTTENVHL